MKTIFETSWVRDQWSPNLGQTPAGTGNVFGDIAVAAGSATKSYFDSQAAEETAKAKTAQTQAQAQAAAAQAQAAAFASNNSKILGMDPGTAAIVGLAGVAAIVAVVMVTSKKK